jgi:hypothetical protein
MVAGVAIYALLAGSDSSSRSFSAVFDAPEPVAQVGMPPASGAVLVRGVDPQATRRDGHLYELRPDGRARRAGRLACKRVHVGTDARTGLCLAAARSGIGYEGVVFDDRYRPLRRFPIVGVPDRARVSSDGRYGGYTTFDSAGSEGYFASAGDFSTRTEIVDMGTGESLLRLDDLEVTRDGAPFEPPDAQFWGVTFAGGDRFYATLATGRDHYLIAGDASSGRARVVRSGIECPALSPDGRRIAYKRRIGSTNRWRLHVLDLDTGADVALAESRSIDDQPEWLGDDTILYSDDRAVFTAPADGSDGVRRLAARATSPAFLP